MPLLPVFNLPDLAARISDVVLRREDAKLKELVASAGDDDLVNLLDSMDAEEKARAFRALSANRQARIIYDLSEYSQEEILRALSKDELEAMIAGAESDDAVDVIQLLDDAARTRVVADLRKRDPHGLLPLLGYGEETAGGLMKTEMTRFQSVVTVEDARRMIAKEGAAKRSSQQLYVVDAQDALVGTVSPIRLLQASGEVRLGDIVTPPPASIPPGTDQEMVAQIFDQHDAVELPVVESRGRLIGIITADDIFDVMEEEYSEDISRLVGVDEDDHITDPVFRTVRRRLPWLVVNLGTAILAATVVSAFQDTIARLVILAAFMPIIAGMGGNAATQTLGVVIRAIALGDMNKLNVRRTIAKQVMAGALNGLVNGLLMGGIAYLWTKNATLSVVIVVAMTLNMLVAGLGGVVVPVTLRAMRIDPALASAVFVTTMTDICGFFVFLGLAKTFL